MITTEVFEAIENNQINTLAELQNTIANRSNSLLDKFFNDDIEVYMHGLNWLLRKNKITKKAFFKERHHAWDIHCGIINSFERDIFCKRFKKNKSQKDTNEKLTKELCIHQLTSSFFWLIVIGGFIGLLCAL